MFEDCGTGCNKKEDMIKCLKCGAEYHIGVTHQCSTSVKMEWSGIC